MKRSVKKMEREETVDVKKYGKCELIGKISTGLKIHISAKHGDCLGVVNREDYFCYKCEYNGKSKDDLMKHVLSVHMRK